MLAVPVRAVSSTFTVDSTTIPAGVGTAANCQPGHAAGSCTLSDAIAAASATNTNTSIVLQANTTYTLTQVNDTLRPTGLPGYTAMTTGLILTIVGNGATIARSTANGTPNFRLLRIGVGTDTGSGHIAVGVLTDLTLRNGALNSDSGAGVIIFGNVTVTHCTFSDNVSVGTMSPSGGAIAAFGGAVVTIVPSPTTMPIIRAVPGGTVARSTASSRMST